MISRQLRQILEQAVRTLEDDHVIPRDLDLDIELSRPSRVEHGDFSTNLPLVAAKFAKMSPRQLAQSLTSRLPGSELILKTDIAGPGFINFYLRPDWLFDVVKDVASQKDRYGRSTLGEGRRLQVEYGSANPTGPIHVGNARNLAYGDVLSDLLVWAGFDIYRENYLNDAGGQMNKFAVSLEARYQQALGREVPMPEGGYLGEYLTEIGTELAGQEGMGLIGKFDDVKNWGLARMIDEQKKTLERFGVRYDNWMSEKSLHESGAVTSAIEKLTASGHTFELDGALWFRATDFGHSQDRVLVRSVERGGKPTYFAADVAYLLHKLDRGFEKVLYMWGADHHGYVMTMQAAARALVVDERCEFILYQFVSFTEGGEPVRMSKRTGDVVTLDELLDEVGLDAARFTFLSRSLDSTIEFDFELVKSESQDNPVYYVQYQHARISSILRYASEQGSQIGHIEEVDLTRLIHDSESFLMRKLSEFPELVERAAIDRAPHRLTTYAQTLASLFSAFYRDCRVLTEDVELTRARLLLAESTRQVLANTFALLGISAPEKM